MYEGYYINLDRNHERRAVMEEQLGRLTPEGLYRRFPAVDGNTLGLSASGLSHGELGCLLSHYLLLEGHVDGRTHLHIIEDDAVMANSSVSFLKQAIGSGILDNCDILFTETAVEMDLNWCREARGLFKSLVKREADGTASEVSFRLVPYLGCTTSYLVNRHSVRAICDILGRELDRGARLPIDILIRSAVAEKKLRAQSLFPFISSVRPGGFLSATREDREKRVSRFAMELLRHSFFVECDFKAAVDLADQWLNNPDASLHDRLHSRLAGFVGSDIFHDH